MNGREVDRGVRDHHIGLPGGGQRHHSPRGEGCGGGADNDWVQVQRLIVMQSRVLLVGFLLLLLLLLGLLLWGEDSVVLNGHGGGGEGLQQGVSHLAAHQGGVGVVVVEAKVRELHAHCCCCRSSSVLCSTSARRATATKGGVLWRTGGDVGLLLLVVALFGLLQENVLFLRHVLVLIRGVVLRIGWGAANDLAVVGGGAVVVVVVGRVVVVLLPSSPTSTPQTAR